MHATIAVYPELSEALGLKTCIPAEGQTLKLTELKLPPNGLSQGLLFGIVKHK